MFVTGDLRGRGIQRLFLDHRRERYNKMMPGLCFAFHYYTVSDGSARDFPFLEEFLDSPSAPCMKKTFGRLT